MMIIKVYVCRQFRNRFAVPYDMYVLLLEYSKEWYPNWDKTGVNGRKPHPLCLKVLGCLRILAKGATFDNVYELNEISAEVNRVFFHSWTAKVVQVLGPNWIKQD